ncbi:phosphoenolpyruvate carboxykinase [Mycobacteroides franklinii]|nr:phosphoenolpyruvate carboxykinase [Mycobacteroides franklinii]
MLAALDTRDARPGVMWTTGNVAEAFPGVFTALGLSFGFAPMEMAFRRMFHDLGVYSTAELAVPCEAEDCFWSVFNGRGAGNIDKFREIANRMPGTTASAVEQQLFGFVRPETVNENTYRRYPFIFCRAPRWLILTPRRHDAMFATLRRWRLQQLPRVNTLDEQGCLAVLADARARFEDIMSLHMGVAMISSSLAEKVAETARKAGNDGLEAALLSGVGSDENEVAHDLWELAHERITFREFTSRHGYHGPNEGQLSGVTWREDPAPVIARLADYRAIGPDSPRTPRARSAAQARIRDDALKQLLSDIPKTKRAMVRSLVRLTARYLALREQGKSGYLLTYDVARAAARRIGAILVERGVMDDVEDVFHLDYEALATGIQADQRVTIAERKARHRRQQQLRLPKSWSGLPQSISSTEMSQSHLAAGDTLTGVAASGGVVTGRARVVRDPDEIDLDEGDILVCETTDPAWVPLFLVAGGVVTDHGGLLSHGPIVARELGIPCVCGTESGSRQIRDGDVVTVDGNLGTVRVVSVSPLG